MSHFAHLGTSEIVDVKEVTLALEEREGRLHRAQGGASAETRRRPAGRAQRQPEEEARHVSCSISLLGYLI
ncbi:MAG: hypothetical protein SGPRY_002807 [Prymnesium sp.]